MWVTTLHTNAESNLLHLEEITQLERLIQVIMSTVLPLLHDILQKSLIHCISIPYSVSSQSIWEYWCPPSGSGNSPVGYLSIPFISGQLFSRVSSKGKGEWNSEIHFVQGGNPGTCAQRPGREDWVSLGAVPRYVQSSFVFNERPEKLTKCFFCILGGWQPKSHRVVSAEIHETRWPGEETCRRKQFGQSCSTMQRRQKGNPLWHSCLLSCWNMKWLYVCCMWKWYADILFIFIYYYI